jgi:phosphoglycerate kinase
VYVNDAFGKLTDSWFYALIADLFSTENKMFGYLINSELAAMDKVLQSKDAPKTAIMGGAKVSDKIQIISRLLPTIDNLIMVVV